MTSVFSGRHHIRFAVKTERSACILFSETPANSIDTSTNTDYAEVCIGVWENGKCIIRVGDLSSNAGKVDTPDILEATAYKYFWISWDTGVIKLGNGFVIGESIITEKNYPSTTDVKYLALFNGYSFGGEWKIYIGNDYFIFFLLVPISLVASFCRSLRF